MSNQIIYFCQKCKNEGNDPYKLSDVCPQHKSKIEQSNIIFDEYCVLMQISSDINFIESMIALKEKDPIEYQLKMSQFRNQVEQQKQIKKAEEESSKPHCPHCKSTNISKIGTGERIGSIAMLGIFSKKINKSFKCKSCGYTW